MKKQKKYLKISNNNKNKIKGIKKCAEINPPRKKPITAIKEGICKLLNPEIA